MGTSGERIFDEVRRRIGWFKSSHSNGSCACVEVMIDPTSVRIRDSKDSRIEPSRADRILSVSIADWEHFVRGVKDQQYVAVGTLLAQDVGDSILLVAAGQPTELRYSYLEWSSFVAAVCDGEFDI
jgi:hypothetical protein